MNYPESFKKLVDSLKLLPFSVAKIGKSFGTKHKKSSIKHTDENGIEFWYARELMLVLEYKQWRRFEQVIERAKEACKNSDALVYDHFADVGKIVKAGATNKDIGDIKLTRYACYRAP